MKLVVFSLNLKAGQLSKILQKILPEKVNPPCKFAKLTLVAFGIRKYVWFFNIQ
jgi:hypothetical protein